MNREISRRALGATLAGGVLTVGAFAQGQEPGTGKTPNTEDERDYPAPKFKPNLRRPRLGVTLIQDFVIYAHSELDMVKLLLEKYPAVLNATVDWGGGDFESALGGASHMGRRDIAHLLLEKGARIDVFAAAMLGHVEVVKALIAAHPSLAEAKGPHGIPLIAHAKAGGKEAESVLKYLETLKPPARI